MHQRTLYKYIFTAIVLFGSVFTIKIQAQTIYVDSANVAGIHNGASWATAYHDFQAAVNVSNAGDTIWVAKGTYQPAFDSCFTMKNGVKVYGGFVDTATLFSSRNWVINPTILLGNDTIVVNNQNLDITSLLDGFTITGGRVTNANGGAGVLNYMSSPVLSNLIISNNVAIGSLGGGMLNLMESSPILTNVTFINDSAEAGGGMFNSYQGSNPILKHVVFSHDVANGGGGGGMFDLYDSPILTDVVFANDVANGSNGNGGGGIWEIGASPLLTNVVFYNDTSATSGGGIESADGAPVLTNVTFDDNYAMIGGAITNAAHPFMVITNCVFWNNTAVDAGADLYNNIDPSVFTTINYCITQTSLTATLGTGNIQGISDPFVNDADPVGPDGIWMTPDDGLELKACVNNPAIDAGNNAANTATTDVTGQPRIVNSIIDMGSYEYQSSSVKLSITSPAAVCAPAVIDLTDTSVTSGSTPGMSFSYYTDTAATKLLANPDRVSDSGIYYIKGTVAGSCSSIIGPVTAAILQSPVVSVEDTVLRIYNGYAAVLHGYVTLSPGITYSWSPNTAMNNSDSLYPVFVNPTTTTRYTLTATSSAPGGCGNSATVDVIVLTPVAIANAFSPNGDRIHDTWYIKNLEYYPNAEVDVFNRYGQLVYQSQGNYLERQWDGTCNGQPLPVGTYYYVIKLNSGATTDTEPLTGSVSIVR